jgi:Glutathione S-transferase, N-terminal domain
MLELYHSGLTTCSKQVRHCLREKGLPYRSRCVELWHYENLSPAYLALNPNGVVPTLVHDSAPIINSFCINELHRGRVSGPASASLRREGAGAHALLGLDRRSASLTERPGFPLTIPAGVTST